MANSDYTVYVVRNAGTNKATESTVNLQTLINDCSVNGVGYQTGSGDNKVQATSKTTAVTSNALTGEITMNNAALAAATIVSFTLNNNQLTVGDMVVSSHHSGGTLGAYTININVTGAGTATVTVRNNTAGSLSEAIVIKFAVFRTVTA